METEIALRADIELGIVPTHVKFAGGLAPDENGRLPRADGKLIVLEETKRIAQRSRLPLTSVQYPVFPGVFEADLHEVLSGFKEMGIELHMILMIGGVNPMDPADESAAVEQLLPALEAAKKYGVRHVASTSVEEWMQGGEAKHGADFAAAVAQNVRLHTRAYEAAGLEGSCVKAWHIEFLRPGEFSTFTDLGRSWEFVRAANESLGKTFFRCLVDAAHCGDSGLSMEANIALLEQIASAGELGSFHASAKTTRGCLSTADGWIGALLSACARTGQLEHVFVELFHHEDAGLAGLRELEPGHGVDTCDGRDYTEVVCDGLEWVGRRLNNYVSRGYLPSA